MPEPEKFWLPCQQPQASRSLSKVTLGLLRLTNVAVLRYNASCISETSSQTSLTSLLATWTTGRVWPNSCLLSAYGSGTINATSQQAER
jgi:hypothetical protein